MPPRLEGCLPYPTLTREIKDMHEEVELNTTEEGSQSRVVVIDSVKIDGSIHLPGSSREHVVAELKRQECDGNSEWIQRGRGGGAKGSVAGPGLFRSGCVTAEAQVVGGDSTREQVSLHAHVDEGRQWRLGDVSFRETYPAESLAFPSEDGHRRLRIRS
jgi:hypothetical protein